MTAYTLEQALFYLYKGTTNVALAAKEQNISTEEMKNLFSEFVSGIPLDDDVWQKDIDLSWPYIT